MLGTASLILAGCGATPNLGRVPIPIPPSDPTPVTAEAGQPQLVAMGDAVRAIGPSGGVILIQALGPEVVVPSPGPGGRPPDQAFATITIRASALSGPPLQVAAGDFQVIDDLGDTVAMTTDPAGGPVAGDAPVEFRLQGTINTGSGSLTWSPQGSPLVTWDFDIETD